MTDKPNTTSHKSPTAASVTDLHFFLGEANNRQGLHYNFPIILVTGGAESGTVPLHAKNKHYTATNGTSAPKSHSSATSSALHIPWPDRDISEGFFPGPVCWAGRCPLHPGADRRCGSSSHPGSGTPLVISPAGSSGCDRPPVPPGKDWQARWMPVCLRRYQCVAHKYDSFKSKKVKERVFTLKSNWISMYFPKRLELSFLNVLALPNACERQKRQVTKRRAAIKWENISI